MNKTCSIPVAQALQRHSGGWKASPPCDERAPEPLPRERATMPSAEGTLSDAPKDC